MRILHYGTKNSAIAITEDFLSGKTIKIIFMYRFAPSIVQNFKMLFE